MSGPRVHLRLGSSTTAHIEETGAAVRLARAYDPQQACKGTFMERRISRLLAVGLTVGLLGMAPLRAEETIKMAFIEPFSGNLAEIGDADLKDYNFILSHINAKGGALGRKFELVTFDSKMQPAEALIALKLRHGPRHPVYSVMCRLERCRRIDRWCCKVQRTQPRPAGALPELRCACEGADQ